MKALIIDDSRAMRSILKGIVKPMGFEIVEAGDGQNGLDCLNACDNFELALVDWNMPILDGLEFTKAVRANNKSRNLKIVMVTTETETAQMVRALMAGVDEFVMKPFTADILIEKLQLIGVRIPASAAAESISVT